MEDNIFTLKYDLQQCIAHNIEKLETEYTLLFYEKDYIELAQALECFDSIKISPSNSKMKFEGKISNDLKFSQEDLLKVKTIVWKQNMAEAMRQAAEDQKSDEQKFQEQLQAQEQLSKLLEEKQNEEHSYRQATWREKRKLAKIQYNLSKIGLDFECTEEDELLLLASNLETLTLNKTQIAVLMDYAKQYDIFIIAPIYNEQDEEDNTCIGIRIAFGIDLMV